MIKRRGARRGIELLLCAGLLAGAPRAAAASALDAFNGHLSIGYARLFATDAPGGNFSFAAGVDRPLAGDFRAGLDVGVHLLGSRTVIRGSLVATLDYTTLDAVLFAHWIPRGLGPVGRVSFGPALISARAELSSSGGGAAFGDLAVEQVAPGFAVDVTLIRRRAAPVRVGLELGVRHAFLDREDWTTGTARLAFHY
jgi:hypothetical protein